MTLSGVMAVIFVISPNSAALVAIMSKWLKLDYTVCDKM